MNRLTDAQKKLVEENYGLVRVVCNSIKRKFPWQFSTDERESAGALGLMGAALSWRPDGGASFKTYASRRILGAILDAAREVDWVPRSARKAERETGVPAVYMVVLGREPGRNNKKHHHTIVDPAPACRERRRDVEAAETVRKYLAPLALDARELRILQLRAYGYLFREIGEMLGCSPERVYQLEKKAFARLGLKPSEAWGSMKPKRVKISG